MNLARVAVALIWAFTMLGAMGALSLSGSGVSAAAMYGKDDDHGNGQGNGGGNDQGQGGGQDVGDDTGDEGQGGGVDDGADNFVTICHMTGSSSNPYVELTINMNGAEDGHANHKGDIIPAPAEGCPVETADDGTGDDDATGDDDGTDDDGTDDDDATDGEPGEPIVVVDIDDNGQGTITFDLDGDGTVDFTIALGENHAEV